MSEQRIVEGIQDYIKAVGEIGAATISQVRSASNAEGEWWVVTRQMASYAPARKPFYAGPSEQVARRAFRRAKSDIWAD